MFLSVLIIIRRDDLGYQVVLGVCSVSPDLSIVRRYFILSRVETIDNVNCLNDLVSKTRSALRRFLIREGIHDLDVFIEYTGGILPHIRGIGAVTCERIKTIRPDIRFSKDLSYPVLCSINGLSLNIFCASDLDFKLFQAHRDNASFRLVSENCPRIVQDKYPTAVRNAFLQKDIVDIDRFLEKSDGVVPYMRNIGTKRIEILKQYHPNVRYALRMSFPVYYTVSGSLSRQVADTAFALSDAVLAAYKANKSIKLCSQESV